jgi:ferredoxin-NADP reductase
LQKGERVKLDVAYGGFCPDLQRDKRNIMAAGGVGITPIYAMCKRLRTMQRVPEVNLINTVHHESEILFRQDLTGTFFLC